jgi:hypothetical protein
MKHTGFLLEGTAYNTPINEVDTYNSKYDVSKVK